MNVASAALASSNCLRSFQGAQRSSSSRNAIHSLSAAAIPAFLARARPSGLSCRTTRTRSSSSEARPAAVSSVEPSFTTTTSRSTSSCASTEARAPLDRSAHRLRVGMTTVPSGMPPGRGYTCLGAHSYAGGAGLRLAIATTEYPPFTPDDGGIGRLFAGLAPNLAELGAEVHVFALAHERRAAEEEGGVVLHRLRLPKPAAGSVAESALWSISAARALRREGPFDVVWTPEWRGSSWAYSRRKDAGPLVTQLCTSLAQVAALWDESQPT